MIVVGGICYGIEAGNHLISYMVDGCPGHALPQEAVAGFASSLHIFVEELAVDAMTTCDFLPTVC